MAESSIPVVSSGGEQSPTTDASLQAGGQANLNSGLSGEIQPVVSGDKLTTNNGVTLTPKALSTISLSSAPSTSTTATTVESTQQFNPFLLVICGLFIILAVVSFKLINDSSKKHNQY